jgi:hypothetical protein
MLVAGYWLLDAGCWMLVRSAPLLAFQEFVIGQLVNWFIGSLIIGN